jgi:hypothetical protein
MIVRLASVLKAERKRIKTKKIIAFLHQAQHSPAAG